MLKIFYIKTSEFRNADENLARLNLLAGDSFVRELETYKNAGVRFSKLAGRAMTVYGMETCFRLKQSEYSISTGEHGKPHIKENPGIHFNISHSGDYILCALSDTEVGIDMEKKKKARMQVARRFYHPLEIRRLEQLLSEEQDDLFYTYWAVKESFLKYTGSGLTRPLSSFCVKNEGDEIVLYEDECRIPLHVRECPIDTDYKCYVCSGQEGLPEIIRLKEADLYTRKTD